MGGGGSRVFAPQALARLAIAPERNRLAYFRPKHVFLFSPAGTSEPGRSVLEKPFLTSLASCERYRSHHTQAKMRHSAVFPSHRVIKTLSRECLLSCFCALSDRRSAVGEFSIGFAVRFQSSGHYYFAGKSPFARLRPRRPEGLAEGNSKTRR